MKKILLGTVALVALAAPASAADLAARPAYTKAPAMIAAVYDWSGFYVGANGGFGSARTCWTATTNGTFPLTPPLDEGCHNATGGTIGGQVGYRWQAGNWVFGVEAQGNWANFSGNNNNLQAPTLLNDRTKLDSFGLFTGQLGYAVNNVLLYVKGGAAVTNDKYTEFALNTNRDFELGSETRWGGVVGAGVEIGFAPNWSVAFQYDHMFMGHSTVQFNFAPTLTPGLAQFRSIGQDVDLGTVRVNYRFGGPVVAKY